MLAKIRSTSSAWMPAGHGWIGTLAFATMSARTSSIGRMYRVILCAVIVSPPECDEEL
jgi:hypothetical protein